MTHHAGPKRTIPLATRAILVIFVPAALSACLPTPKGPAPRYLGTVTPTTPGPLCPPSRGSAVVLEDRVQFAPDEGVWILDGIVNPSGTITADRSRMGANKQPYVTTFEGRWTPTTVTGTYKTPKCSYAVDLKS